MNAADAETFNAAIAEGREIRIRTGDTIQFARPVEIHDDHLIVRTRGNARRERIPTARIDEIRAAGST